MTEKLYKEILTAQTIATYYQQDHQDNLTYSDEELEAYYQENKNNLDTFNYSVFTVQASIETTTTDEEGNSVDLTDEEKQAAFDTAKAQAQVEADRIIEAAKAEAAQEMQRAREQLRGEVAALAVAGAEQILAREVDKTVHAQLLEQLKAKL